VFDPLRIAYNKSLLLQLRLHEERENFQCLHYTLIDNGTSSPVARYTLQNISDSSIVVLEVYKDSEFNFHIEAYQMIEERPFSPRFALMLGTDVIAFKPKNHTGNERALYDRILYPGEEVNVIKYICDISELPVDPYEMGYTRDGNGNWYQILEQSQGRVKKFTDDRFVRCWEYENDEYTRLLIEREETHFQKPNNFYIYLGLTVKREQIHLIENASPLPASADTQYA
jgi:hypothetical protein